MINELIGIAIVSVSVLAFLEPIVERIRSNIGLSEAHTPEHTSRPLAIKLVLRRIQIVQESGRVWRGSLRRIGSRRTALDEHCARRDRH